MAAVVDAPAARPRAAATPLVTAVAIVAGCTALTLRPLLWRVTANPDGVLVALFVLLLAAGAWLPVPETTSARRGPALFPLAAGAFAFAAARLLGGGHGPSGGFWKLLVLNGLAAVAEEAFFRRLVYGALVGAGPGVAVAGSAVLFALVHVTTYGFWVFPLDLAAGALLGWQRAVSGRWSVPAVSHVLANALILL
jgi:membrane protease YdiL (CAAX protease family)